MFLKQVAGKTCKEEFPVSGVLVLSEIVTIQVTLLLVKWHVGC
jgi:hypothetical protein